MATQLTLFAEAAPAPKPIHRLQLVTPQKPAEPTYHVRLQHLAFCYTATEKGNNSGIRFMMSLDDAQTWCESPISQGTLHGTRWAYFWTTVRSFISCHWGPKDQRVNITGLTDNGTWDARIASLGLQKIGLTQFCDVLPPLGVTVINGAKITVPPPHRVLSTPTPTGGKR